MRLPLIFLFFLFVIIPAFAQDDDSTLYLSEEDSLSQFLNQEEEDTASNESWYVLEDQDAPHDTSIVQSRSFDSKKVNDLRNESDLNYKEPPTVAESLWTRFWLWVAEIISNIFDKTFNTSLGNWTVWIIATVVVVIIVMMLLKVDAFRVLYGREGAKLKHETLDENIHEMDFEKLIQEAVAKQDYRRGIRLLFLFGLKILSDKQLVRWEAGKTNHEYVAELKERDLQKGFNELSFYFDYAWYGNFNINADTFQKAETIFTNWKQKVS